jgi:hypothetical protein
MAALLEKFHGERFLAQQLFWKALERRDTQACRLLLLYLNLREYEIRRIWGQDGGIMILYLFEKKVYKDTALLTVGKMVFLYDKWAKNSSLLWHLVAHDRDRGIRESVPRWKTMDIHYVL